MPRERDSKLAAKLSELRAAEAKAGGLASGVNEIRMRIVWAAERYADLADSVARNLSDAAKRIRETEDFAEPRSATGWCGGLEDLMRLRGEIDALTTALEITEHFAQRSRETSPPFAQLVEACCKLLDARQHNMVTPDEWRRLRNSLLASSELAGSAATPRNECPECHAWRPDHLALADAATGVCRECGTTFEA
ncbi:MAG TPA: hypothetical protein P5572_02380 [Phycisphaerae bacterium]|nr:hypothetical protein [Phycisphaerae bacterium]